MRVKLIIEYDGTSYAGWQRQKNGVSVQEVLETAFEKASGVYTVVHGSGRTDAGVHALAQVAHIDTICTIPPDKISFAMNTYLPADIRVKQSTAVSDDFHARFSARGKTYRYTIHNAAHAPAICRNTAAHVRGTLDVAAMREAAGYIEGTHDFASFCASGSEVKDTTRTVYRIDIKADLPKIVIEITGSGFLYNMVRIIAGTLIDVGLKKMPPMYVRDVMEKRDRTAASATAPAQGLTLMAVYYAPPDRIKNE